MTLVDVARALADDRCLSVADVRLHATLRSEARQLERIRELIVAKGLPADDPAAMLEIILL